MNPRFRTAVLISSLATLALSIAPAARADGHHHRCSLRGVAGTFGYVTSGTRIGVGPVAGAGILTFDGDGNVVDGKQTVSFNGTIATETYSGTYTVAEDCTGSFTVVVTSSVPVFNRTSTVDLVWEDDANAAHAVFAGAGTIITADARRLFSHD
jgi:hypothetical protein